MVAEPADKVRIDKWLWAARFFKTRALATEAVQGGKVHLNDGRIKPSRNVNIGDKLSIQKGNDTFVIRILELSGRRGPAKVAETLYEELPDSILARTLSREERKQHYAALPETHGRPDKKSRRQWRRITGRD